MGSKSHVNHSENQRILSVLNRGHLTRGRAECREQARTHRTHFLKLFLGLLQRGEAVNPQKENSQHLIGKTRPCRRFKALLSLPYHLKVFMVTCTMFSACKFLCFSCKTIA